LICDWKGTDASHLNLKICKSVFRLIQSKIANQKSKIKKLNHATLKGTPKTGTHDRAPDVNAAQPGDFPD
jgi:hypothetical protein